MLKKVLSSQLRINMASGFVATVVNAAVMLAAYRIYLHFLGYEKYGVWLVLATVLTFIQFGDLGIGQAIMKLVAEEKGRNNIKGIQNYVVTALAVLCISGTSVFIVLLILKSQIVAAFKLNEENAKMVSWLLPYIGVLSVYAIIVQMLSATVSGLGRMDLVNWAQSGGQIASVAIACFLLYNGRGIESLLIGNMLSNVLVHLISIICIRRRVNIRFLRIDKLDSQCCKRLLRFGGGVFGGSLINMLLSPFNKLMLSRNVGVSAITIYEIAYTGSMQIRALFEAGLRALMPEVSRLSQDMTKYAKDKIDEIYQISMKLIFGFGLPMYGFFGVFAPFLFRVWLGSRCDETLPGVFRIMMVATFFTLIGVPAYYTIMGLGKIRYFVMASVISVGGDFILVTAYYALTRHLSVYSIGLCLVVSYAASTTYLICKTRCQKEIK